MVSIMEYQYHKKIPLKWLNLNKNNIKLGIYIVKLDIFMKFTVKKTI